MSEYRIKTIMRFGPNQGKFGEYYTWKLTLEGVEGSVSRFDNTGSELQDFGAGDYIQGYTLKEAQEYKGEKQWKLEKPKSFNAATQIDYSKDIADIKAALKIINGKMSRLLKEKKAIALQPEYVDGEIEIDMDSINF